MSNDTPKIRGDRRAADIGAVRLTIVALYVNLSMEILAGTVSQGYYIDYPDAASSGVNGRT